MSPQLYKNEQIQSIEEFENYAITSHGRVWSYVSNKWLKPTTNKRGNHARMYVSLGRGTKKYVHRLVAQAFIPNPENLPEVDHIDTDGTNNHVDNLRWVTHDSNMQNRTTADKIRKNTGYCTEIKDLTTQEIFVGYAPIMEKYGVSEQTILNHLNKKVKNPKWERTGNKVKPPENYKSY